MAEMTFLRNDTIWYAFYSKFATFRDIEKIQVFFRKTHLFFQEKTRISNVLRNLTISVAFNGKFTNWSKNNFTFSSVNKLADKAWMQLANIGLKNVENDPFERKILLSYC